MSMASPQEALRQPEAERKHAALTISLANCGGAIGAIGEKFVANPVTGTVSVSVPLAISAWRSGLGPQLSLFYDSGADNGPLAFGWDCSLERNMQCFEKEI
jgi:Salmonella virulence plasmid 65kDa B protein